MRRDSPLAEKSVLTFEDIYGLPLFTSEQSIKADFPRWCGENLEKLNIVGTFNLSFNGSIFVKERLGYLLTFEQMNVKTAIVSIQENIAVFIIKENLYG